MTQPPLDEVDGLLRGGGVDVGAVATVGDEGRVGGEHEGGADQILCSILYGIPNVYAEFPGLLPQAQPAFGVPRRMWHAQRLDQAIRLCPHRATLL